MKIHQVHPRQPSLILWLILGVCIIGGLTYFYTAKANFPYEVDQLVLKQNSERLQNLKIPDSTFHVVMMGSSLLGDAVSFDHEFDSIYFQLTGHPITVTKIIRWNATISRFHPFLEDVANVQPDVVILTTNLFFANEFEANIGIWGYLRYKMSTWMGLTYPYVEGALRVNRIGVDTIQAHVQLKPSELTDAAVDEKMKRLFAAYNPEQPILRPETLDIINNMVNNGTQIWVLKMPRAQALESRWLAQVNEFDVLEQALRSKVSKPDRISFLPTPIFLPDTHFKDLSHVNIWGREQFENWLIPRIDSLRSVVLPTH